MKNTGRQEQWKVRKRREIERQQGYVAIYALGLKREGKANGRTVRIGYSADPASNIRQGQKWNHNEFELLALLWAQDLAHAKGVYNTLRSACDDQKQAQGLESEYLGPWYWVPGQSDSDYMRMIMEFAIKDAAVALGDRKQLLIESEYDAMIDYMLENEINRAA